MPCDPARAIWESRAIDSENEARVQPVIRSSRSCQLQALSDYIIFNLIPIARGLAHLCARRQLRYTSTAAALRESLRRRIEQHYVKQGDSLQEGAELACSELRWLEEAAREEKGAWEHRLAQMVDELVEQNKPLAYILGNQPFHPLPMPLLVRPPTLIPRPETEHWLSHLTTLLHPPLSKPFTILDIGTGTGCIPLALVCGLRSNSNSNSGAPDARAVAVDKADTAVELARENVERCSEAVDDRVKVVQADLFAPDFVDRVRSFNVGGECFDLVVSNPPYIPRKDYAELAQSVKGWEDRGALVGELRAAEELEAEDDGLIFYRRITNILQALLVEDKQTESPVVAFEVGAGQASAVEELLRKKGFRAESFKDQWGVERMVIGYRV